MPKSKPKCRGCKRTLVASYCWPNGRERGWGYLYCPGTTRCAVLKTEVQGEAPDHEPVSN